MPIKKFKSFEKASKNLWVFNPDDKYYNKLKELFILWNKLSDKKIKQGIQRFKSFADFVRYKDHNFRDY